MKISKKDALIWFTFFASLPEGEELMTFQQEIVYAVFAQIEEAINNRNQRLTAEIKNLKTLENRTYFVGNESKFPGGCRSCLLGTGLGAVRKTNKCNLNCAFCYDYGELNRQPPVGEGLWEIGGTKFYEKDLNLLLSIQRKPTGISYVYLEPFMEIEKYYPVIRTFHNAQVYQHLYTNGTLATEATLKALGDAGLDEIRFNLGATNCADQVIANIKTAKKYIPAVGVETPMTPAFYNAFFSKQQAILDTGLDFINCAELHLNPNNVGNFAGENMYFSRRGYLSPIWSRELTLKLMKIADDEQWDLVVHDCSNDTKFARDLHLRAKEGGWFGASSYACEFEQLPYEAFLPILRDEAFAFLEEEELPKGYRPGELTF
ncbi:MAG: radical SAM protein [Eubacteriales bacterium]|nr:radical SAM protein [Eubacteriales bacterium]